MSGRSVLRATVLLGAVAGMAFGADPALAQGGDGFLFREPRISLQARFGYAAAMGPRFGSGDSDIFGFTQRLLTIQDSDHDALSFGGEVAIRTTSRLDVVVDVSYARSDVLSEFRDYVFSDDLPIQQTTQFSRVPLSLSARYFLGDRGRRLSRFAWVPRSWVPYLGAGVGFTRYSFEQDGDFVDFDTLEIINGEESYEVFTDRLLSSGSTATAHLLAGMQVSLSPMTFLTGEARYRFGHTALDSSFLGFDDIDLSGLDFTVGLGLRF